MQIILLEKVVNVGNLGEVVRVRDGYARNFLIPQKKARRATEAALKEFEVRRAELEKIPRKRFQVRKFHENGFKCYLGSKHIGKGLRPPFGHRET